MFLLFCLLGITYSTSNAPFQLQVSTNTPIHTTELAFLSLGMDSNLIRNHWQTWDFDSKRLRTLARGISPAILRLCGTDGDRMTFAYSEDLPSEPYVNIPSPGPPFPASNFTMSAPDWNKINIFAADVGWRIMFGFNVQLRNGSDWDSQNAKELLRYSIKQGYASNLDFELGNEPDLFFMNKYMHIISAKQLAADYKQLRDILRGEFKDDYSRAQLHGPGIAYVLTLKDKINSVFYLKAFADNLAEDIIDGFTWHQYYGGSELKHVDNYTDPSILDEYVTQCKIVVKAIGFSPHSDLPIWQGETSSTYAPPGSDIDMSYVAGFMLLDKLGVSAKMGMRLVIRQTFFGFWFALVNDKLNPTPNYWVSLLYRRLAGTKVLDVSMMSKTSRFLRTYANCITRNQYFSRNAVIVYAMNLNPHDVMLDFSNHGSHVYEYLFEPDNSDLLSSRIRINGQLLTMPDDQTLPDLITYRRSIANPHHAVLPAKRFAFYVIDDASAEACE